MDVTKFNARRAIDHLNAKAKEDSTGNCAKYVREALLAGGIKLPCIHYAKDFGSQLVANGFVELMGSNVFALMPVPGDVLVIQPHSVRVEGHVAMFNGTMWVSDFKQDKKRDKADKGLYPGALYRVAKPAFKLYRYSG